MSPFLSLQLWVKLQNGLDLNPICEKNKPEFKTGGRGFWQIHLVYPSLGQDANLG